MFQDFSNVLSTGYTTSEYTLDNLAKFDSSANEDIEKYGTVEMDEVMTNEDMAHIVNEAMEEYGISVVENNQAAFEDDDKVDNRVENNQEAFDIEEDNDVWQEDTEDDVTSNESYFE